ncbi:MAG: hypothetical protein ACR2P1_25950 [Pseudomonadales bacterium]
MRGRAQALIVAVPSAGTAFFFWVGAAAIGLVTLRKGAYEGGLLCLWSVLPAALLAWLMNPLPLMIVLCTYIMAVLLRSLASWPAALLCATVAGALFSAVLLFALHDYMQEFLRQYTQIFAQLEKELARQNPGQVGLLPRLGLEQMAGMFGVYVALFGVVSLVIARYWQALLYNPGGFRQEFHALRMPAQLALPLVFLAALCLLNAQFEIWAWIFLVPLMIAGIALVHALAARRKVSSVALTAFYVALILINPVKLLLCIAAVFDSWMDFRVRFA